MGSAIDSDTLASIYEAYYKKVYNYISYRIDNRSNVEELVSMVFEKVITKYTTYRPECSPLEPWIIGIAKNTVADYFRKSKRKVLVSINEIPDTASENYHPDQLAIINEENAQLIKALDVLADKERNILTMKFATDLKNGDIGEIMGMSKTNVSTVINRALNKLRKELERIETL